MRLLVFAALALGTAGCPGPRGLELDLFATCVDSDLVRPGLRLVAGPSDPSPLSEGARLPWDYGFQGGQHIYINLLAAAEPPDDNRTDSSSQVEIELLEGTSEVGFGGLDVNACPEGTAYAIDNLRVFVREDREMDITVEARLRRGSEGPVEAVETARVRVVAPE